MGTLIATVAAMLLASPAVAQPRPDDVAEFARARVTERLIEDGYDARVSIIEQRPATIGRDERSTLSLRPIDARWPRARVAAVVDMIGPHGQAQASRTVWLAIDIPTEALVYAVPYGPGERPEGGQLVRRTINQAGVDGALLSDVSAMRGMRLRHAVRAGQVVEIEHFEQLPDVQRNDRIALSVDAGAVSIRVAAVALQDGRIGDVVDVRAERATESVRARVVSKGVASLEH